MFAFAANSLLCRLALQHSGIDPASFATLRLVAGALMLAAIIRLKPGAAAPVRADWLAAAMLWAYAACFAFAYVTLTAGTGALILFGAVQLTMFSAGLYAGERFAPVAWVGLALALAGFVWLVSPGIEAPAPLGAALMAFAGIAWGIYSLRGRKVPDPLAATAGNFLRAAPMAIGLSALLVSQVDVKASGAVLAVASGAVTSGIGYVVWYAALRGLSAMRAATVQLAVPPVAAFGGVLFLSEAITLRLGGATLAILGGVALVLMTRSRRLPTPRA